MNILTVIIRITELAFQR